VTAVRPIYNSQTLASPELGLLDEEPTPDFPFGEPDAVEVQVMLARFY
jgi:hypothetical protein